MDNIKQVELNGEDFGIKDATAREGIDTLNTELTKTNNVLKTLQPTEIGKNPTTNRNNVLKWTAENNEDFISIKYISEDGECTVNVTKQNNQIQALPDKILYKKSSNNGVLNFKYQIVDANTILLWMGGTYQGTKYIAEGTGTIEIDKTAYNWNSSDFISVNMVAESVVGAFTIKEFDFNFFDIEDANISENWKKFFSTSSLKGRGKNLFNISINGDFQNGAIYYFAIGNGTDWNDATTKIITGDGTYKTFTIQGLYDNPNDEYLYIWAKRDTGSEDFNGSWGGQVAVF